MTYTSRILRGWQLHRGAVQSFHVVAARSREICMKVHVYTEMAVCVCMLQPNSMYLLLHFNKSLGLFLLLCLPVLCVSVCFSTLFPVLSVFLSPSVLSFQFSLCFCLLQYSSQFSPVLLFSAFFTALFIAHFLVPI